MGKMRKPRAISPSAFMLWEKDPREYTLRHLVPLRPDREPQPEPASVGSAFDAYVKYQMIKDFFGRVPPEYEFSTLFESQVEQHNWDMALRAGKHVFKDYVSTGAYVDLMELMEGAQSAPRFEFSETAELTYDGKTLFLMGKPDCQFINRYGIHVILDWKVKGYCSKYGASPCKNYRLCRDGRGWPKPSRSHMKAHKNYAPVDFNGIEINQTWMEESNREWATQLGIYGWLLGEAIGDEEVVVCIDEVVAKFREGQRPLLRVAQHRARISNAFQTDLFNRLYGLWDSIQNEHIRNDMTKEDSQDWFQARCQESMGSHMIADTDDPLAVELAAEFADATRLGYR